MEGKTSASFGKCGKSKRSLDIHGSIHSSLLNHILQSRVCFSKLVPQLILSFKTLAIAARTYALTNAPLTFKLRQTHLPTL
jgi:hypothetical protein